MKRILLLLFIIAVVGCGESQFSKAPAPIDWDQTLATVDYVDSGFKRVTQRIEKLEARSIPPIQPMDDVSITEVSYSKPVDPPVITLQQIEAMQEALSQQIKDQIKGQTETITEAVKAATVVSTPQSVVSEPIQSYSSAPVQTYSGPKTYGAPQQAGFKTTYQTRSKRVAKQVPKTVYETVYETVQEQVPVKVPVMKRPVYSTVQEQVPYQVSKTVMRSETRQRTKTVMVPQEVTENYSVQVPETVTETKFRTVSKKVQIGEEEVAVPSYSAAPQYASAPVCEPCQAVSYSAAPACVECQPSYSAAPQIFSAPAPQQSYAAAPVYADPFVQSATVFASTPAPVQQVYSAPQAYSQPVFSSPAQSYSAPRSLAAPAPQQLVMQTPVSTAPQRAKPFATAAKSFSTVRRYNTQQSGGGLFRGGKQRDCPNGQCPLN